MIGTTTFSYDWADRLVSANLPDTFSTAVPTFAWRADGLIKSRTFDTGAAVAFSYDRAKRLATIAKGSWTLGQTYDRDSNVATESRNLGTGSDAVSGTQTFTYDGLNRVLSSSGLGTGHEFTYEYDHDGNRTKKDDASTTWTYAYDRTDQLSSINAGLVAVTYNQFGDMTSKPEDAGSDPTTYAYDFGGKLTAIGKTGTADDASFTFDALGRFRTRVLASSTDTYSYLGTSEAVIRIDSTVSGADIDSIITSAGDRLGIDGASTMNWLLPDPHGSVAASLSFDENTVTNAIRYDPWGDTLVTGGSGGVGADKWKYQGRLDLSPSGIGEPLYDFSARFYSPSLGLFTQLDSVMGSAQNPLSMNRFLYAQANPATLIDPSGHCARYQDGICVGHSAKTTTGARTVADVKRAAAARHARARRLADERHEAGYIARSRRAGPTRTVESPKSAGFVTHWMWAIRHGIATKATVDMIQTTAPAQLPGARLYWDPGNIISIAMAGPSGKRPGRPDVYLSSPAGTYIWEIKHDSEAAVTKGIPQLARYLSRTPGALPGYPLDPRFGVSVFEMITVRTLGPDAPGIEVYSVTPALPPAVPVPESRPDQVPDFPKPPFIPLVPGRNPLQAPAPGLGDGPKLL